LEAAIKVLLLDIETAPIEVRTFGLKSDHYIPYQNIINDWFMLCACWKWEDEPATYAARCDAIGDDRRCTSAIRDTINQADVVVHHNGDKFDLRKINARVIFHDLKPMAKPVSVDTLKIARKEFGFTSSRLDYLGKHLLGEGKIETHNLWNRVMDGEAGALDEMVRYCRQDVLLLEKVYQKLKPYATTHPNANLWAELDNCCPRCRSTDTHSNGWRYTKSGRYQRKQCRTCGHWFRGKKKMNNPIQVE